MLRSDTALEKQVYTPEHVSEDHEINQAEEPKLSGLDFMVQYGPVWSGLSRFQKANQPTPPSSALRSVRGRDDGLARSRGTSSPVEGST